MYKELKEKARQKAIEYQQKFLEKQTFWSELAEAQAYFETQAKRYGLIKEFKENGII